MPQTRRFQNASVAADGVIMNLFPGDENILNPADVSLFDILPELCEMEKMDLLEPDFTSNYSTIIGHIYEVELEPEHSQDVKTSSHRALRESAMPPKLNGLVTNYAVSPVSDPSDRKVVGVRRVFTWKTNNLGQVVKAKTTLVAKGSSQRECIDYFDSFQPRLYPLRSVSKLQ